MEETALGIPAEGTECAKALGQGMVRRGREIGSQGLDGMQVREEIELGGQSARAWSGFGTGSRGGTALGRTGGEEARVRL